MEYKYLYIDDDKDAGDAVDLFLYQKEEESLIVQFSESIANWDKQQEVLDAETYDGLMVDLNLNDQRPSNDDKAKYSGTEIAQRLRTKSIGNACPIVLYSANDNIDFWLENKKSGLFDLCISKDCDNKQSYAVKMYSLAKAYKIIQNKEINFECDDPKKIEEEINKYKKQIFGVDHLEKINKPFADYLQKISSNPTYIIAQFILNEFICKQGILIDEEVLAARLGIDKEQSPDWNLVLKRLDFAKYKGVFNEGWPRWWMFEIDKWWNEELKAEDYLVSTPAAERVKIIKEKAGVSNIVSAAPLPKAESDLFWTICKGHHKPLDPVDGLAIQGQENLFPWQETESVSIDAAMGKKNYREWKKIAAIEQYHFEKIKKHYGKDDK